MSNEANLVFNFSVMNGQKTADLLMKIYDDKTDGKPYLPFKPKIDTRDGEYISSRALEFREKAIVIQPDEVGTMFALAQSQKPQTVYVDEVSLMTVEQVEELSRIADELNIPVYTYGLLVDFQQNLFPASRRLLEIADRRNEIEKKCPHCNNPASQNMRLLNGEPVFEGEVVKVGGNESYRRVCRKCYNKFKKRAKMKLVQNQ